MTAARSRAGSGSRTRPPSRARSRRRWRRLEPGPHTIAAAGRTDAGRPCHGPGRPCRPGAGLGPVPPVRGAELPPQAPTRSRSSPAPGWRTDWHARFSADRAALYLPHPAAAGRRRCWRRAGSGGSGIRSTPRRCGRAAAALIGRHDFTTFRSSICQANSPVKTLDALAIEEIAARRAPEIRLHLARAVVPAQPGPQHRRHAGAGRRRRLAARAGGRGARRARPRRLRARGAALGTVSRRQCLSGVSLRG